MFKLSLCLALLGLSQCWREERARVVRDYLHYTEDVLTFVGNITHSDHFKLLREDGSSLLIGARNVVYNLTLADLTENLEQRISWEPEVRDRNLCLMKGKSGEDCNNYIRVLAVVDTEELLVCGTNAYNPLCRNYSRNNGSVYEVTKEYSGKGYCPYDPRHNSTSIYTDGDLYSGTVSDFSGSDALIIKNQIRTGQYNLKELNGPDFVGSIEDKDFVYFFFREEAVEFMNCGKAVYSRVARVCKGDNGGPRTFKNKWTTFSKARLNCSVSGAYPFYFDQVQAMSQVVNTKTDGTEGTIFGIFNTPENSITGSAICSFKMSDILDSFDGPFRVQADVNSNWLPLAKHEEPDSRPGSCHNDSRLLDDKYLNFIKENTLMDRAVSSTMEGPHYIKTSPHERLTTIAVDPSVPLTDGQVVNVLFAGTSRGRVLKLASFTEQAGPRTELIEELQVFPLHVAVNNILISRVEGQLPRLVVLSDHEVKSVPVERCGEQGDCGGCVGARDPYCAWNIHTQQCHTHQGSQVDASSLLQNIAGGFHSGCGSSSLYSVPVTQLGQAAASGEESRNEEMAFIRPAEYPRRVLSSPLERGSQQYSEKTLSVACLSTAIVSILLGFLAGFVITKKCSSKDQSLKCGHANLEALMLERSSKDPNSIYESPYTTHTPSMTTKNNLLSNHPVKTDVQKNNLSVNSNTGTLGKCKKIYI